jgi:hypothetical protein
VTHCKVLVIFAWFASRSKTQFQLLVKSVCCHMFAMCRQHRSQAPASSAACAVRRSVCANICHVRQDGSQRWSGRGALEKDAPNASGDSVVVSPILRLVRNEMSFLSCNKPMAVSSLFVSM